MAEVPDGGAAREAPVRTRHHPHRTGPWRALALVGVAILSAAASADVDERRPDVVERTDGERLEGVVVYADAAELVVRVDEDDHVVPRAEIASATTRRDALGDWLDRVAAVDLEDPTALLELAGVAASRTLHDEAELVTWLAATALSPDLDAARRAAGLEPHRGGWRTRRDGETFTLDELTSARAWSDRVTLHTEHHVVHTSAPIRTSALLTLDIASLHRSIRDELSPTLRLFDPERPLVVHLYGRDDDAPLPADRPDGAFTVSDRTLHLPVEDVAHRTDDVRRVLARELVRLYLHETTVAARRGRGPLPPWLEEGLAGLAADGLTGVAGAARVDWDRAPRRAAARHVRPTTRRPEDAGRVVGYGRLDLAVPRHAEHRRARCTTLLYTFRGHDRAAADELLREALAGRSSFGRIEEIQGLSEPRIESLWAATVAGILGS